jgi:hypothetical protein
MLNRDPRILLFALEGTEATRASGLAQDRWGISEIVCGRSRS